MKAIPPCTLWQRAFLRAPLTASGALMRVRVSVYLVGAELSALEAGRRRQPEVMIEGSDRQQPPRVRRRARAPRKPRKNHGPHAEGCRQWRIDADSLLPHNAGRRSRTPTPVAGLWRGRSGLPGRPLFPGASIQRHLGELDSLEPDARPCWRPGLQWVTHSWKKVGRCA